VGQISAGVDNNTNTSFAGVISGTGGLAKIGTGTQTFTRANTYTGTTTVSDGVLNLGVASAVASSSNVVLGGGTLQSGFSQTLGTLNLSASSTLDLSTGGTFVFANSSALAGSWTGTLSIIGTFSEGVSVRFGTNDLALTSGQLSQITINGIAASINASGYLTSAVPEPSTYAAIFGVLALAGAALQRRHAARR
jgi:autotransporter-associated beta strand protein